MANHLQPSSRLRWVALAALIAATALCCLFFLRSGGRAPASAAHTAAASASTAASAAKSSASGGKSVLAVASTDADAWALDIDKVVKNLEPRHSPFTGNATDLTPDQERAAMELWEKTQQEWRRFRGLSGSLKIDLTPVKPGDANLSFDVSIDLRAYDVDPDPADRKAYPPAYRITLKDKGGRWTYTRDTKTGEDIIDCPDVELANQIRGISYGAAQTIWEQPDCFLHRDWYLTRGKDGSLPEIFSVLQAMKNPEAEGAPDSYMFAPTLLNKSGARGEWYFQSGHFTRMEYKDIGAKSTWSGYKDVNGFQWSMEMQGKAHSGGSYDIKMTFSDDLKIDTSMRQ